MFINGDIIKEIGNMTREYYKRIHYRVNYYLQECSDSKDLNLKSVIWTLREALGKR